MGKCLVLLLGMHRSGTSLAARAFAAAGLPMGEHLLTKPVADNPEGYWEDAEIVAAHEAFLVRRFGSLAAAWWWQSLADPFDATPPADLTALLGAILRDRLAAGRVFGFKDPRTARLLPLWLSLARAQGVEVLPVLLLRHPAEVAASLAARNAIPHALGELMWLRSVTDVLRAFADSALPVLAYADWFEAPARCREVVDRTLALAGLPRSDWPSPARPEYRHQSRREATLSLCATAYEQLVRDAGPGIRTDLLRAADAFAAALGSWEKLGAVLVQNRAVAPGRAASPSNKAADAREHNSGGNEMKDVRGDLGGHPYSRFLAEIAKNRNIRRYLEIGVAFGANLSQIACETAIGVDPAFGIKVDITQGKSNVHLYRKTSDRFFRDVDVCSVLGGPIEMAFLDGLHLFEYLLRDFYNTEALCAPESLIAIHDCLPVSPDATSRTNTGGPWTGDVWKLVPILKTYRPDLNVILVDCPPTGLVLATGLDPCSRFLRDNYLRIVREFAAIPSDDAALRKFYSEYELVSSGEILHGNNHTLLLRI